MQIKGKENHEALIQYSDNPIDKYKDTTQHSPIHKELMQNSSTTHDAKVQIHSEYNNPNPKTLQNQIKD